MRATNKGDWTAERLGSRRNDFIGDDTRASLIQTNVHTSIKPITDFIHKGALCAVVSKHTDVCFSMGESSRNMRVEMTTALCGLLTAVEESTDVSPSLKEDARVFHKTASVPFALVKKCCLALRGTEEDGPWINEVCKGSRIVVSPPKKRQCSPEFSKRLEELRRKEEDRKYQKMVHNVAKRDFEDNSFNILPNARLQMSFGAHVLVTMLVFFLLGSYASRAFADSPVLQALGGVFGLVFGLILETTLFIIRSVPTKNPKTKTH